jgi:hypothetical protein
MSEFQPISDDDLTRARADAGFRHKLLARSLSSLLVELNRLRTAEPTIDATRASQIREGAKLAVQLADLIRAAAEQHEGRALDVA